MGFYLSPFQLNQRTPKISDELISSESGGCCSTGDDLFAAAGENLRGTSSASFASISWGNLFCYLLLQKVIN
ncbi:hypothetical protein ACJIZ3_005527 [Penstemon smallii]|uniref:Uncharacterized protein n=1 Tax=Penstemon smallii TaxID=265156 RepID=A0ABD3S5C1_9LAMI